MSDTIKILFTETLAQAWGRLDRVSFEQVRRDGTIQRHAFEVYDHGSAAAMLLVDPERDTVLLIRQFRLGVHVNGDPAFLLEACAGLLDGDTPEACARREAEEETGYRPRNVRHVLDAYMSPGSLTEKVSCFIGDYSEADRVAPGGGLAEEGEDIELVEIGVSAALTMIRAGLIIDAKTVMLLQHLALERAGLA